MKIYLIAFGCKVSGYEVQHLEERFAADGHTRTDDLTEADVCVINSCTVTAQADTKLRHFIKRAARENPRCLIVLAGCFPQAFPDKAKEFAECGIICGTKDKTRIPELVYERLAQGGGRSFDIQPNGTRSLFEPMTNTRASGKTRAYIKIQDGCDIFCTYCVIPKVRGHYRSVPMEDLLEDAASYAERGVKELILVAQETTVYGVDLYGKKSLHILLE